MTTYDPTQLQGTTAIGSDGDKIGAVRQVYVNDATNEPEWVTVSTGLFGTKDSFAPLTASRLDGDSLVLAVTKDAVKGAPNIDDDGHTGDDEQTALYDYYSGHLGGGAPQGYDDQQQERYAGRSDDPGLDDRDRSGDLGTGEPMTRSEEQLRVGTENVETSRVRIRKYVVTENVAQTVPVSHEEVRIERVPLSEDAATGGKLRTGTGTGSDMGETEQVVTLHAERPVVAKETVPVEQIRVRTETVTGQETVNDEVRKERIDVDDSTNER